MSTMAESSRKRFKAFDGRAATLLKQTSQLATLCGSPACIVIYSPHDVTHPWRIWPDNEADFRSVIQTYNESKKLQRQTAQKSNATRRRKAAATIDDVGSSTSSSSLFGEYRSATPSGRNGLLAPQLTPLEMDLTTSQARFDKCIVPLPPAATLEQQGSVLAGKERTLGGREAGEALASNASITIAPPQAAATVEHDFVLVGKEEAWAGKEAGEAQAVNTTNVEAAAGIHSFASTTAADTVFDGLLSCEWGDTELFELDELLNSSEDQGMMTLL